MHLSSTRLLPALVDADPYFRRRPEAGLFEMDNSGPELQGGKQKPLSLSFKFVFGNWLSSISNTCETADLERNGDVLGNFEFFITAVCEDRHFLPTRYAIKLAQLVCSISRPGNEELSQLANSVSLLVFESGPGAHPSPRLFNISLFATCIGWVRHTLLLLPHWRLLPQVVQHLIKLWQQETHKEPKSYRVIKNSSGDTKWSWVDSRVDSSPRPPQNDTEAPADAP